MKRLDYNLNWKLYLKYDENSPSCLVWNCEKGWGRNKVWIGKAAGHKNADSRFVIGLDGNVYMASVIIWCLFNEIDYTKVIDHVNQNKSDNRISNLRQVTQSINCRNKTKQSNNSSGVTGVSFTIGISIGLYLILKV